MEMPSRAVQSNQQGPHQHLLKVVQKHRRSHFAKPLSAHSQAAFEQAQRWLSQRPQAPLIFDACCGVGQSSRLLAAEHPHAAVVGVDKSEHRLQRSVGAEPDNLLLLRADLNDFYRLASGAGWRLHKHAIFYPNPWPKAAHLGRRWHAAPVFPSMLSLGGALELRSNWPVYLEEFALALGCYGIDAELSALTPREGEAYTPFEAKYYRSGQSLWQLRAQLL